MKKFNRKKIIIAIMALTMSVSVLSGCNSSDKDNADTTTIAEGEQTTSTHISLSEDAFDATLATTRPLDEGDVFAIYKFKDKLPEGYTVMNQNDLGKAYLDGASRFEIAANNYKNEYPDLATFADSTCANIKVTNMLYKSDTIFEEPVETKVAGFDALSYDFTLIINQFIKENPDDEGDGVKTEVERHKARAYFFASEKDIFCIIFQTSNDKWDSYIPTLEAYIESVYIDESVTPADVPVTTSAAAAEGHEDELIDEELNSDGVVESDLPDIITAD